jgi:hypothetical protein
VVIPFVDLLSNIEKLGLPRVLEVLHTCDWASVAEEEDSIGSLQDDAFDDDKADGSERDVEYMERMMAMLISAKGIL